MNSRCLRTLALTAVMVLAATHSFAGTLSPNQPITKAARPQLALSQVDDLEIFDRLTCIDDQELGYPDVAKPEISNLGSFTTEGQSEVNFSPVGIMLASSATAVLPEPSSIVLLVVGSLGVLAAVRRRRRQEANR